MVSSLRSMHPVAERTEVRWLHALAGFAFVGALFLAFGGLDAQALWLDEAFSINDAQRSVFDMFRMRSDRGSALHPPLHGLVLRASLATCGDTAWCARAPSALAAAAVTPIAVVLSGRLFGWGAAITAAWLWPTLPYLLKYAHQARGYTLLLLLSACALCCATQVLGQWKESPPSRRSAVGLGIFGALLIATHLLAVAFVATLALACVVWARRGHADTPQRLRLAALVAALGSAPVLLAAGIAILQDDAGRFASQAGASGKVIELFAALLTLSRYTPVVPCLLVASIALTRRRMRWLAITGLAVAVLPLAPLVVRTPGHFLVLRYFMPSLVPIGVLACAGVGALLAAPALLLPSSKPKWLRLQLPVGMALAAVPTTFLARDAVAQHTKRQHARSLEPWDEAVAWIDQHTSDDALVVVVPYRLLRYPLAIYTPGPTVFEGDDPNALLGALRTQHPRQVFVLWSHIDSRERERALNLVFGVLGRTRYRPDDNHVFGDRAIIVKSYKAAARAKPR